MDCCVSLVTSLLLYPLCFLGIPTKERKSAFPLILQRFLSFTLNPQNPFKSFSGKGAGVYPSHPSHCWPELMGKHKMSAAAQETESRICIQRPPADEWWLFPSRLLCDYLPKLITIWQTWANKPLPISTALCSPLAQVTVTQQVRKNTEVLL